MRAAILLLITVVGTASAFCQTNNATLDKRSLSLQECLELALRNNLDLQIERASTDIARFKLDGAYGIYEPVFSFQARHDFVSQPGDFDPQKFNPDFPYELRTETGGAALNGQLPFGLAYDFNASAGRKDGRTDFTSDTDDAQEFPGGIRRTNNYFADARVELRQHLLKDFWIDSGRTTLLLSAKDLRMARQTLAFEVMRTALAVQMGYYDLIAGRERVRVQQQALQLRQQLLTETRRRVEVGDLPPLDAEQAETQLQITLTALASAQETYAAQQNAFKALLTDNFRAWADIEFVPSDTLLPIPPGVDRSASFESALRNRPDLAEARVAVEKRGVAVQFRLNQLFPALDLVGRYGGLGVNHQLTRALDDSLGFGDPQYYYGVVLSFPLSNLKERNDYRASKADRHIAELQLKKAEQAVLVEVADWVNRVRFRFTQVDSTKKASGYAETALQAEQRKLENGFSTSFFVLQLQQTLTEARTAEIQALVDYYKALAQLSFAEGSILNKNKLILR